MVHSSQRRLGGAACAPSLLAKQGPHPLPASSRSLVCQVVKNDQTSVLIRTLQNKKAKEEAKRKQTKAAGAAAGREAAVGLQSP